jgi:hypothetical protein
VIGVQSSMASWGEVPGAQYYNVIRVKTREIIEHKNKYGFGAVMCIKAGLASSTDTATKMR